MEIVERHFELEHRALKLQVSELETKLEAVKKDLADTESSLAVKNAELAELQTNLKELEELREMKEVTVCHCFKTICESIYFYVMEIFSNFYMLDDTI